LSATPSAISVPAYCVEALEDALAKHGKPDAAQFTLPPSNNQITIVEKEHRRLPPALPAYCRPWSRGCAL